MERKNTQMAASQNAVSQDEGDKTAKLGLWVGMGIAAIATVGVLALAFYTEYKANQSAENSNNTALVQEELSAHGMSNQDEAELIATEMTQIQIQGMEAPADEENMTIAHSASETAQDDQMQDINPTPRIYLTQNDNVASFYFDPNRIDLDEETKPVINEIVASIKSGKKAAILGYIGNTKNTTLNQQRIESVRQALLNAGATEDSIVIEQPENPDDKQRVEVILR